MASKASSANRSVGWARHVLYSALAVITMVASMAGTLAWYAHYIATVAAVQSVEPAIAPIDVAGVTATLGGLVLIGAFYKGNMSTEDVEKRNNNNLKLAGKLLLLSSVCLIVTHFCIEYVRLIKGALSPLDWGYVITTDTAASVACFALSISLGLLVYVIPSL